MRLEPEGVTVTEVAPGIDLERDQLAIRRKGIVTIPEAIREELDLHEGDHLVATVEDGRLILIPASVIPDDQAWFWTPEWQAKEEEADQEIADGDGLHVA